MGHEVRRQAFRTDGHEVSGIEVMIEPATLAADAGTLVVGVEALR